MSERDELISKLYLDHKLDGVSPMQCRYIADLILADRKATVQKVVGTLKKRRGKYLADTPDMTVQYAVASNNQLGAMIDKSLKLAEEVCK